MPKVFSMCVHIYTHQNSHEYVCKQKSFNNCTLKVYWLLLIAKTIILFASQPASHLWLQRCSLCWIIFFNKYFPFDFCCYCYYGCFWWYLKSLLPNLAPTNSFFLFIICIFWYFSFGFGAAPVTSKLWFCMAKMLMHIQTHTESLWRCNRFIMANEIWHNEIVIYKKNNNKRTRSCKLFIFRNLWKSLWYCGFWRDNGKVFIFQIFYCETKKKPGKKPTYDPFSVRMILRVIKRSA